MNYSFFKRQRPVDDGEHNYEPITLTTKYDGFLDFQSVLETFERNKGIQDPSLSGPVHSDPQERYQILLKARPERRFKVSQEVTSKSPCLTVDAQLSTDMYFLFKILRKLPFRVNFLGLQI